MVDVEALLVQILILAVFGVIYAWIGGKVGFKSGIKAAKKEIFALFEINPNEWKHLSPTERRAKLINIASSLIRDTLKQATPNPETDTEETEEDTEPLLPEPEKYS